MCEKLFTAWSLGIRGGDDGSNTTWDPLPPMKRSAIGAGTEVAEGGEGRGGEKMGQQTSLSGVRLLIVMLALGFFAYNLGPPLFWHLVGDESQIGGTCPPCPTECPEDVATEAAIADLHNVTLPACPKIDADMKDELQKTKDESLQEEMNLQKAVAEEAQTKSNELLLEAKKTASQYQKDFEKCNTGMKDSEGARAKAEGLLAAEKKKAALWEARAKKLGWKEGEAADTTAIGVADEGDEGEETADATKTKVDIPRSKNGPQITAELHQNLAVARFLYDRAVQNEMSGVKVARQRASELNLL